MTSGHAIVRDVKRQPVVVENRAHSQGSPSGIYGSKSGTGSDFPSSTAISLLVSFHKFSSLIYQLRYVIPSVEVIIKKLK
jgi:hypothetical protein